MPVGWDYAAALDRVGDDESLLSELIAIFFEEYPKVSGRLSRALVQSDFVSLAEAAHSLKGSLGYLGAIHAEGLALEIEHAARARDLARATDIVKQIMANIELLRQVMVSSMGEQSHAISDQ